VEELAGRGKDTLAFGPMKPVGLVDPRTGTQPFAVVQLRREDQFGSLFNLVGFSDASETGRSEEDFSNHPRLGERRVRTLGSVHRNTFVDSPGSCRGRFS